MFDLKTKTNQICLTLRQKLINAREANICKTSKLTVL